MQTPGLDSVTIATAQHVDITYEAAGAGDRIIASLIDGVIQVSLLMATVIIMLTNLVQSFWPFVGVMLLVMLYHPLCETFLDGQSIGKRVMRTRVVRVDGSRAGLGGFIVRWLFSLLEIWSTGGLVALIALLLNRRGQRLGDLAAETTVVRLRDETTLGETGFLSTAPDERDITMPKIASLSSTDIQTVRDVLQRARTTGRTSRTDHLLRRTKDVIEDRLALQPSEEQPYQFLLRVMREYNAMR